MARPRKAGPKPAQSYRYPEADLAARPEIGAQAHFKKAKPPATYHFDSSLAPELQWDGQNPARESAERLIAEIADCGLRIADLAIQPASSKRDQEIANRKSVVFGIESARGFFLSRSGACLRNFGDEDGLPKEAAGIGTCSARRESGVDSGQLESYAFFACFSNNLINSSAVAQPKR
jgi:hypothetical protein